MRWIAKLHDAVFRHRAILTANLATLREGELARVTGVVAAAEPLLTAPLTGRRCVYWSLEIGEVHARSGERVLARNSAATQLVLVDNSGSALVHLDHIRLELWHLRHERSMGEFDATPVQHELLTKYGLVPRDWLYTQAIKYREAVIVPGDRIELVGSGIREPDLEAAANAHGMYRDEVPTRLRLSGSAAQPLLIRKTD